ncbi:phage tail protein [Bacillus cereus group sp. BY122LC]|uniref:phage tail spike protein n=1 Tax=Bacillus cereus group sp. BY122LC TaxID=3018085 RepID=UPI0022E4ED07|nr:phage tail spike protein [Bacillus cereus group sp. BY122LC]MDA1861145.1 phage tail protein [Bacillus cereus group sp. BY122LC]
MITLYKPNETDFTHNGIGILDNNIYEAEIEEILNGVYTLRFKYPLFAPHGLEIDGQYLIKAPTPDGDQLFRVANPHPTNGEVQVFCYHIFYDLVDNFIEDTNIVGKTGFGALDQVKGALQYPTKFDFYSDIGSMANARLVRKNPVEFLLDNGQDNSFLNRWGGELLRDNFNVRMLARRGRDRGVVIQHKKDLLGYEADVDWQSVITKIMPQGANELLLPEKYVTSPLVDKYVNPKIRKIDFPEVKAKIGDAANDDDAIPLPDALNKLRALAVAMFNNQHVDQPLATYKIKFQELSQTEEYKDLAVLQRVYMGDTVTVQHLEEGIDVIAKVVSYKYDPLNDEYTDITLGNYKESFTDVANKVDRMQDNLDGLETSFLEKAKDRATDLINSGFGGHVRIHPERILIMDTEKESTAKKVWQWNINGLGYSSTGINGPYGLAMTMDGSIVADFITTGKLNAAMVQVGFNEYGNTIKLLPEGLESRVSGKRRMLLNDIGQLAVFDDSENKIGFVGYQQKINNLSFKGMSLAIQPNRFLSLSVYAGDNVYNPYFEIVDNPSVYGIAGNHLWKDLMTNGTKIVFNASTDNRARNFIQELLYEGGDKRLALVSDQGIDFARLNGDAKITVAGVRGDYSYSHGYFYANGGIGLDGMGTNIINNGIFRTSGSSLAVSSATKTMLCYAVNGSFYEVFTVTAKNNLDAYGELNMHNWSIVNTSVNRTLVNNNIDQPQTLVRSLATVNATKEMSSVMSSSETFTHIGEAETTDGQVQIDLPIFFQNETSNYHVFISKYGRGDIWVSERNAKYFIVESDNDISFSYEIKIVKEEELSVRPMLARSAKARSSIFDMAGDIPEETSVDNKIRIDESEDKGEEIIYEN